MKKILIMIVAVALCSPLFLSAPMAAQEKKGKTPEERFAALDKNNDKKLSKDEFLATTPDHKKDKGGQRFAMWDKDKDGFLSLEEYKEGVSMMKKKN